MGRVVFEEALGQKRSFVLYGDDGKATTELCGKVKVPSVLQAFEATFVSWDSGDGILCTLESAPDGLSVDSFTSGGTCKVEVKRVSQTSDIPLPQSSGGPPNYLKYMETFANYAVSDLSFEESSILSVPSPSAVFTTCGEVFPLFMRKEYLMLISCINARKRNTKIFSVQGTAGIGKSVFGMLWVLQEAQRGGRVIWHIGGFFFLLDFRNKEQVEVNWLDRDTAEKWMHAEDIWLIADGRYEYQFSAPCYVLQVCSFKEDNHHEFTKTPRCQILYHPVWSEDEILCYVGKCEAHNYETTDKEDVKKCFAILGGVARYLLQPEVSADHDEADKRVHEDNENMGVHTAQDRETKAKGLIKHTIENFEGTIWQLLKVLRGTYVAKLSDKLVHCFATEECVVKRMDFASDYVKKQTFSYLMKKYKLEFRKWLEDYKDDQSAGCMWGGLFETYAHQVLHQGGSFTLQNLQDNRNEEELVMNSSMERLMFSHPEDLERLEKESYCKPPGGFTSIDSLFAKPNEPPVLFQMFKRQTGSHGFVFDMLRQIDKAMKRPAYKLVSVVPKHLAATTRLQQYYDTEKKVLAFRLQDDILLRGKLTQYVLSLDFSFIERESVWKDL